MGTRGLTEIIHNGQDVVVQYGQWDHYPEGQGMTALYFLNHVGNVEKLRNNLHLVTPINEKEMANIIRKFADNEEGWMGINEHNAFTKKYPSLSRDTGASILEVIANAKDVVPVQLDKEFRDDDVFCEGRYIINLDDNTFTSMWYGKTVTYSLDSLPLPSEYLAVFDHSEEKTSV